MSLGFGSCWVFFWQVFPSWLSEGQSVLHLLFSVLQLWVGCIGAGSSMCTRFCGFSLALVQLFVFSNFSHYLFVFSYSSWVDLVWLPFPPSPSSVLICWCFLCCCVSSSRRYPGVSGFYPLFFMVWLFGAMGVHAEPPLIHTVPGLNSLWDEVRTVPGQCIQSPGFCLWSQFLPRWGVDTSFPILKVIKLSFS